MGVLGLNIDSNGDSLEYLSFHLKIRLSFAFVRWLIHLLLANSGISALFSVTHH